MERAMVPRIRYAVTVNYSIATIYRRLYGTPFRVVRNMPERIAYEARIVRPEQGGRDQMIIYQGALNVGRGLELMIDAMQYVEE
jgi:hypothetical protein